MLDNLNQQGIEGQDKKNILRKGLNDLNNIIGLQTDKTNLTNHFDWLLDDISSLKDSSGLTIGNYLSKIANVYRLDKSKYDADDIDLMSKMQFLLVN